MDEEAVLRDSGCRFGQLAIDKASRSSMQDKHSDSPPTPPIWAPAFRLSRVWAVGSGVWDVWVQGLGFMLGSGVILWGGESTTTVTSQ